MFRYLFVLLSLFMAACTTPYARQGDALNGNIFIGTHYGYDDKPLGDDRYWVSYRGNLQTDTPHIRIYERLRLRAAQVTMASGHKYFVIEKQTETLEPNATAPKDLLLEATIRVMDSPEGVAKNMRVFEAEPTLHTGEGSYLFH